MDLARRSIASISWNVGATVIGTVLAFSRMVVLARILPVEVFGIYEGMRAIIDVTATATDFGFSSAFIHRAPETEDVEDAARVHFSLKIILVALWILLSIGGVLLFAGPASRLPFIALILSASFVQLTQTGQLILARRVAYRRVAGLSLASILVNTAPAIILALSGAGIWSLVSLDILNSLVLVAGYYLLRPVWRPAMAWNTQVIRYYLGFGARAFSATLLYNILDRIDDLWTRFSLGEAALGFYSRAYGFATSPRVLLANPIASVIAGTFAELKYDRLRLSQAFFRTSAFMVRSGFFLGGLLALIAPEFIRILLTERWLPMLGAFRLMLVFTLFDPLKLAASNVLGAVGKPEKVVYTRLIQLLVMVAGLALLAPRWGIAGVALAVDVMLLVGVGILFSLVRRYVDFSLKALFAWPLIALFVGMIIARGSLLIPGILGNDYRTAFVKSILFASIYFGILFMAERQEILKMSDRFTHVFRRG